MTYLLYRNFNIHPFVDFPFFLVNLVGFFIETLLEADKASKSSATDLSAEGWRISGWGCFFVGKKTGPETAFFEEMVSVTVVYLQIVADTLSFYRFYIDIDGIS